MKKTTILTKVLDRARDGYDDLPVTVYENGVPGLFVGRMLNRDRTQNGAWDIYHHTGYLLIDSWNFNGFPTRKKAAEAMQKLGDLTDWTQGQQTITRTPDLFGKLKQIYMEARL